MFGQIESEIAMREIIINELSQVFEQMARDFAHYLPRLVVLFIIALIGWLIAYLLKLLSRSLLRLTKFSKLSENAGATQLLHQAALPSSTELVSRFVFWVSWVGFVLMGISFLGIAGLQEYIAEFFYYLPRLFVGMIILFLGLIAASFFSRAALLASVNANFRLSRTLSMAIRVIIIVFVLSMVFEVLGVAQQTVLIAFSTMFGAAMLGFAIAFGIGGQDLARKFLERKLGPQNKEEREDDLSPL
jgi:small-conductance mechanosensitive channel